MVHCDGSTCIEASHWWWDPVPNPCSLRHVSTCLFRLGWAGAQYIESMFGHWLHWDAPTSSIPNITNCAAKSLSLPALPNEVLQQDWWVPGSTARAECSKYQGKEQFRDILTITLETCRLWIARETEDCFKVSNLFVKVPLFLMVNSTSNAASPLCRISNVARGQRLQQKPRSCVVKRIVGGCGYFTAHLLSLPTSISVIGIYQHLKR